MTKIGRHLELKLGLSEHSDYYGAGNIGHLNLPYLFHGFLPRTIAASNSVIGLKVS